MYNKGLKIIKKKGKEKNDKIYFMVECHIATCPDDHMAVWWRDHYVM